MIYEDIISVYNIDTNSYAAAYNQISESSMMKLIFSKFISDAQYDSRNVEYINYFLKYNYPRYYEIEDFMEKTVYYENNLQRASSTSPEEDIKIIDIDVSEYASKNIRLYLFYADLISQLYDKAYSLKRGKHGIAPNEVRMKCRYVPLEEDNSMLKLFTSSSSGSYDITLKITRRDNLQNDVVNVQIISDQNASLTQHLNIFKPDIMKHLQYLNTGTDVKFSDASFLQNIRDFYRLCRLKLAYLTCHSIKLLATSSAANPSIAEKITYFIRQSVLPVFINAKKNFSLTVQSSKTSSEYNDLVFDKTGKLSKINERLLKYKNRLLKNRKKSDHVSQQLHSKQSYNIIAKIVFAFTILATLVIIAARLSNESKRFMFMLLTILVLIMIAIIYFIMNKTFIESFQGLIKFPRQAIISNSFNYDNIPVRVDASTTAASDGSVQLPKPISAYFAFNNDNTEAWTSAGTSLGGTYLNRSAKKTYKTGYAGEYLKIDLGEYMVLKEYTVKHNVLGQGPVDFIVYAASSNGAWQDVNSAAWNIIDTQTNIQYDASLSKTLSVSTNETSHRYYMMIVNKIASETADQVNISEWELRGERKNKQVTISTTNTYTNSQSTSAAMISPMIPINLPTDYDDTSTEFSYQIRITGQKTGTGAETEFKPSIIFNNGRTIDLDIPQNGQLNYLSPTFTDRLNLYRSGKIEGMMYAYLPLTLNYTCSFILSYYPVVPENEKEELIIQNINDVSGTPSAIEQANTYYQAATVRYNNARNAILELQSSSSTSNALVMQINALMDSSNQHYQRLDAINRQKQIDLLAAYSNLGVSSNLYIDTSNLIKDAAISLNDLNRARTTIIEKYQYYLSVSQRLTDATEYKMMVDNLQIATTSSTHQYTRNLASITEAKLQKEEETARASIELAYVSYLRLRETALQQRDESINKAAEFLAFLNQKYNLNETNADNLLTAIQGKLESERAAKNAITREYDNLVADERALTASLEYLRTSVQQYDELIVETNGFITELEGLLQTSRRQKDVVLAEKQRLEFELAKAEGWKQGNIDAAQARIDSMKLRKDLQIQELRAEKNEIAEEIARQIIIKEQAFADEQTAKNYKENLPRELQRKIEARTIQIQQSAYYEEVTENYEISNIFKDMDVQILYNITDDVNGLNYEMVVPILNKEYDKFNKLSTNIQSATTRSDHDINVKWIDSHHARAQTRLFMHISLVICVCMVFYYNQTPKIAVAIAIIASTVIITLYNVEITRRVRTRHRHNYWIQPKKYRETMPTP
jgi:hypothetical protein